MSVEWSRLRILDAVARSGSVTRAAARLRMTGPAVSQQLRRIESETGCRVVVAEGRGIRLTSRGRVLAGYARQVAELMQRAENDMHRSEELTGRLRLGAVASVIRTLVVAKLPAFHEVHPRLRLMVDDGETTDHLDKLRSGRLDLVLAESWTPAPLPVPEGCRARHLIREPAQIALPAGHPLATRERIALRDLADERWATCAEGSDAHAALVQAARREDVEPDVCFHVADHITQLALVRAGLAVACLPASAEVQEFRGVIRRPLTVDLHRDIILLSASGTASLPVAAFAAHLTEAETAR